MTRLKYTTEFKVGDTYRARLSSGKSYKIHILAIVDEHYIVYKWYGVHKQWWHYQVHHGYELEWKIEMADKWKK